MYHAFALIAAAWAQASAFLASEQSKSAVSRPEKMHLLGRSLHLWPWEVRRHLRLLRLQADILTKGFLFGLNVAQQGFGLGDAAGS